MSVPSLNSVHVLCRFTFSYPAMNFSFCRFTHHPSHTTLSHTPSFATPSFTHHFVTHHLSQTTLSHALFHTRTHNFHTHTHTIFHTQLCHTPPSFFVTHHLSHTTLSHTTLFYFSILHHLLHLSFLPRCGVIRSLIFFG